MKRLHLVMAHPGPARLAELPYLSRLIARGRPGPHHDLGCSKALARLFGVDTDALPAIEVAAKNDAGAWFRADPVHMVAGLHSLTLFDDRHFNLTQAETEALLATLNRHFEGEIEFRAASPTRWHARLSHPPAVEIAPLDQVAGGEFSLSLIAGPGARELERLAMEIQMLLHDHPVNAIREVRNEAVVNSVWLWGGGAWRQPAAAYARVYANDPTALALGRGAGARAEALPERFEPDQVEGDTLVVLPDSPREIDGQWFQPLLSALRNWRIAEAQLILTGPAGQSRHLNGWRSHVFWRNR